MIRFLFRLFGLFLLGTALVAVTVDGARSIAAAELVATPLARTWRLVHEPSFETVGKTLRIDGRPDFWRKTAVSALALPTALVAAILGSTFMLLGMPRRRSDPFDSTVL